MNVSITTRSKIESVTITLNETEARELHEHLCYTGPSYFYLLPNLVTLRDLIFKRLEGN